MQCLQKPSALSARSRKAYVQSDGVWGHKFADWSLKVHQDSDKQDSGLSIGDSNAAVNNVEMKDVELKHHDLSMVAWTHDRDQEPPHHPPIAGLDKRTLKARFASLLSRVTAVQTEIKQKSEESDHVGRPLRNSIHSTC